MPGGRIYAEKAKTTGAPGPYARPRVPFASHERGWSTPSESADLQARSADQPTFLWRVAHKRIDVIGSNAGNVVLNTRNPHPGEFGANLMYWNLNRGGGGARLRSPAAGTSWPARRRLIPSTNTV